jgi:hypothetical protein
MFLAPLNIRGFGRRLVGVIHSSKKRDGAGCRRRMRRSRSPHERSDMRDRGRRSRMSLRSSGLQSQTHPLVLATCFVRGLQITPPQEEGARDPQERARGRPGARCTRGLVCNCASKKQHAHEHTGSAETLRPSLRNGFTAYIVLSLVAMLCHHRPREALASQDLTPALGRQDHTT